MKKLVEFTKSFANKDKGDSMEFDSMLASHLVNVKKVAKYAKQKKGK